MSGLKQRSRVAYVLAASVFCMALAQAEVRRSDRSDPAAPSWVRDAIFYQIFPDRFANGDTANDPAGTVAWGGAPTPRNYFGGDLQGIIERLAYLSDLGVTALYLNPIFESPSNHKYATSDYMKIDPGLGDEETLRRLVDSCHRAGIRVILDGVFNHTGVRFFAFEDVVRNGAASPYRDWYRVHSYPVGPPGKPNYECWWGYGHLPKLMTGNPAVRKYLFEVTRHWLECGIDGWRLDVPNEIPHDFWIEWRHVVKSVNPEAYITGEIWKDAAPWLQGDQFDGVTNYRFRDACLEFFARETIGPVSFDSLLARQRSDYPEDANYALQNLLGSHDTERFLTACGGQPERVKLAWLFQMTYPGAPMIYYGDEVGMEGGKDPDCRRTMTWKEGAQQQEMHSHLRDLIALRRAHPVLRRGSYQRIHADDGAGTLAFRRSHDGRTCVVILNRSEIAREVSITAAGLGPARLTPVWPANGAPLTRNGTAMTTTIPPMSGVVYTGEE